MKPITGVISIHNVKLEYIDNEEICLDCMAMEREITECEFCPECGGDLLQVAQDYIECEECLEEYEMDELLQGIECFDHTKLIGNWKFDTVSGKYEPDTEKEFSAIVTSSTFACVQVVWSRWTTNVRAMCSPCFPGQADLDSGEGNIIAYTLPDDLLENQEFIDIEKEN